jgi:hypothetical protein
MKYRTFRWIVRGGLIAAVGGAALWFFTRPKPIPPVLPKPDPAPVAAPAPVPAPAPAPVAAPVTAPAEGVPLRAGDTKILEAIKRPLSGDKGKDAVRGSGWKVNLYRDAGKKAVNRLKIDLDGDGKWDEKWTIEDDQVKRQVAPADDEHYTEEWRLRGDVWVRK